MVTMVTMTLSLSLLQTRVTMVTESHRHLFDEKKNQSKFFYFFTRYHGNEAIDISYKNIKREFSPIRDVMVTESLCASLDIAGTRNHGYRKP